MSKYIKIKKGLDIPLMGKASGNPIEDSATSLFGIVPDDFPGIVWKARVKPGDKVSVGDKLLSDKASDSICLVTPVEGEVKEIIRGERRKIMAVTVQSTPSPSGCIKTDTIDLDKNASSVRSTLQKCGLWALMRQRPYDIVPAPDSMPRDIYITTFDSAPLAPALVSKSDEKYLASAVEVLSLLTSGKVYLGVRADSDINVSKAEMLTIDGPHPAGNVGVQIAATNPVNKGETVWTMDASAAIRIGKLYLDKELNWKTTVAITGPEAIKPHFVSTCVGAKADSLLADSIPTDSSDLRIISGNVLTGKTLNLSNGFLRFPYRQITIIKEGADADEFMGWASMNPSKFSIKRTFPAFLRGLAKPFPFDARIKGGHRAMILSEEYDKVFPFDIYPEYLLKAIIAGDIDRMEKLGIYEVAPEDFALPEFIDTSKIELQKIVRDGLDKLRAEEA